MIGTTSPTPPSLLAPPRTHARSAHARTHAPQQQPAGARARTLRCGARQPLHRLCPLFLEVTSPFGRLGACRRAGALAGCGGARRGAANRLSRARVRVRRVARRAGRRCSGSIFALTLAVCVSCCPAAHLRRLRRRQAAVHCGGACGGRGGRVRAAARAPKPSHNTHTLAPARARSRGRAPACAHALLHIAWGGRAPARPTLPPPLRSVRAACAASALHAAEP
jgi:hypothetical protein